MSEDINEKFDPADLDMVATDKDKAGAKMNIIMQLRKAADVKGNLPIKFADGKSAKLPPKVIELALKKFASFRKPDSKEKLQTAMNKSYKDMVNALKTMREETEELGEGFSPKEIKMAIGVATDKRYKGGNMTGATQAIDKIKKGLSDHPQVRAVLKRVNEDLEEGVDKAKIQKQIDQTEKHMKTFFGNTSSVKMKKFAMQKKIDKLKAQLKEEAILDKALNEAPRPPKINKGKAKGSISATGMRGKGNKKYDVMVGFDNGKFSFRITDEGGRFQTVGIKQASKMLGEENVNSLGLQELTSAEKKLINQMYDKKGNLTPIGKKVMDQGKAASKLSPKDIIKDKARRKEYTAFQKSKRNEELDEAKKSDYTIYHKTFSSAVQHAIDVSKKRGFEVDEDDWDRKVAMGPRKPGRGKTNSYTIDLMKSGKSVKNKLQMQVYYDEGRYELNMYIS